RRCVAILCQRRIDPRIRPRLARKLPERIVAELACHLHLRSCARCGNSLVGSFAARPKSKVGTHQRLTPHGQARGAEGNVGDKAAENENSTAHAIKTPCCSAK